ncbi:MAG: hypothetical protein HOG58_00510 [Euryarchaeota archaeon]|jgi:hypothetical protein|nr:hypothetical protein [Euryarchaeota archaeon]MDG1548399.1 hypothetical protein [Candidatus Thalassarchaeaceae archaeon]MBT4156126.1 hypothetical protein [Euryarchaeota archaeon]MBT4475014.1 hypothetical protein [Euryarchaeota archaeon]MBT4794136.1 hypothetical protein [Euryarchaeota archaeon]
MGEGLNAKTLAIVVLLFVSFCSMPSYAQDSQDETVSCCESSDFDLYLLDESSNGRLSPFENELSDEFSATVSAWQQGEIEVGTWEVIWGSEGNYPTQTWSFTIPYKVEGAVGVTINSTLDIRIGGSFYSGNAGPGGVEPFLNGEGELEISVQVTSGTVNDGDKVELSLSMNNLLFSNPTAEAGLTFLWGSDDSVAKVTGRLPLVDIKIKDASVTSGLVYFPINVNSGFDGDMWSLSTGSFMLQGSPLTLSPIATPLESGVEVTFVWEMPEDTESGIYTTEFIISPQSGLEISVSKSHEINIGDNNGGTGSYYPSSEPLRTSGSVVSVEIDAKFKGDIIEKKIEISFDSAMSQWMRWGMDNIGNTSLDSNSWWKNLNSYSDSVATSNRNNGKVDDDELLALTSHIAGSSSDMRSFMQNGLSLDIESIIGINPVDLGGTSYDIDMGGTRSFAAEEITITIETSYSVIDNERQLLIEKFIRNPTNNYWKEVNIDVEIKTTMLAGLGPVSANDIDFEHRRWIFLESIQIKEEQIEVDADFRIEYLPSGNMAFSPLVSAMISVFALCVAIAMGLFLTRNRSSMPSLITVVALGGLSLVVYVLGMPMQIVLAIVASSILLVFPISLVSPKSNSGNGSTRKKGPSIDCPACGTSNPVESKVRPLRFECSGCDVMLRIEE